MKVDKEYSLKPFGTGTSCIDTIHGECIRDVSLDECMRICENSDSCGCGIHVDMKDRSPTVPTYCLPLNTVPYKNRPVATSIVSTSNNGTILSKENNVDISFFRRESHFPSTDDTYNQLKSDLIFNYDIVNFDFEYKPGHLISLQSVPPSFFKFSDQDLTDFYMIIKGYDFSTGEITRIHNLDVVYFFYKHTSLVLTYNFEKNQFIWGNFSENSKTQSNVFKIVNINDENFVDYVDMLTPVNIITEFKGKDYYLMVNENNTLIMSERKPSKKFYISNKSTKEKTIQNVPNDQLRKDRIQYMNENMKWYMEEFFPDKSDFIHYITLSKISVLDLFCYAVIIVLVILIMISLLRM